MREVLMLMDGLTMETADDKLAESLAECVTNAKSTINVPLRTTLGLDEHIKVPEILLAQAESMLL